MSNQVVGRAKISLGAIGEVATEKGATLDPGGVIGEPKPADNGRIYRMDKVEASKLSCKIMATPDISSAQLKFNDATVLFEADTGQKWMIRNAFTSNTVPLDSSNGTYDLEVSGDIAEEI